MPTDSSWPVWPTADGGVNPGTSAIGRIAVGRPSAETAGAQPDPSTIATSCSAIPTRSAMNCAAVRASSFTSGRPSVTVGSLIGTSGAELAQHPQKHLALVRGKLSEPVLLAALNVHLHGVFDTAARFGDREQARPTVIGVGHSLDVAVLLQLVEGGNDAGLVGADRLGERGLGADGGQSRAVS